ncbi:cytochrome P450 [Crepidotus variabilis]|uniref:Cytochrome P450 n=1 Tax=Crepidotus variabilis TaxID=179855 RepID=A0A9P6EF69_9AGAR|nr:cytochrome P450 [Crepidotus variabilis]
MDAQDGGSNLLFWFVGFGILITIILRTERSESDLRHIPTPGYRGHLRSYIDAFKFAFLGPTLIQTAYQKYRPGPVRFATLHRWIVVMTGAQLFEEFRKLSEEEVSLTALVGDSDFPLYHAGHDQIIGTKNVQEFSCYLTQNLSLVFPRIREEVSISLKGLSLKASGWTEVEATQLVLQLVTAVNHRVIFGLTSIENEEFNSLGLTTMKQILASRYSLIFDFLPQLRSSVFAYFTQARQSQRRYHTTISAFVSSRISDTKTLSSDRVPHDLLSWTLSGGSSNLLEGSANALSNLTLSVSESISTSFLHVLYYLSANPKYASLMRKEVEASVSKEGWNKSSVDKMHRLDSFIKESLRLNCVNSVSSVRKVLTDLRLSDGTVLPFGSVLCLPSSSQHLSSDIYGSNSTTFDGFRFSRLQEQHYADYEPHDPGTNIALPRYQLATSSSSYLTWGYGRHACPGRFYASMVMKLVLAMILVEFDIRFLEGVRPDDVVCNGARRMPGKEVKILIRRR